MRTRPRSSTISAPADAGIRGRTKGSSLSVTCRRRSRDAQPLELLAGRFDRPQRGAQQLHHVRFDRGVDQVLVLTGVVVEVEKEVRVDGAAPGPEGHAVTWLEGLADDGDVGPRHEV